MSSTLQCLSFQPKGRICFRPPSITPQATVHPKGTRRFGLLRRDAPKRGILEILNLEDTPPKHPAPSRLRDRKAASCPSDFPYIRFCSPLPPPTAVEEAPFDAAPNADRNGGAGRGSIISPFLRLQDGSMRRCIGGNDYAGSTQPLHRQDCVGSGFCGGAGRIHTLPAPSVLLPTAAIGPRHGDDGAVRGFAVDL
jgi:hypothetical protein